MPISVSDPRSNPSDQIAHAVEGLGHAKQRIAVFKAIYWGKKVAKSVSEIAAATGLPRKRVLEEGKRLADNQIVKPMPSAGMTCHAKDPFYSVQKNKILRLVQNPAAFAAFPTKTRPKTAIPMYAAIRIPLRQIRIRYITIDDIDSFARVGKVHTQPGAYVPIPESRFKNGIATILKEDGHFKDWGGERNDLYTSKMRVSGKRFPSAFAFKGPGKKGILTPAGMGKNGDQIQRLFGTPATVFIVQYWGQIAESVTEQMQEFAKAKSVSTGTTIYYGVIDGDDSHRLLKAYPNAFK